MTAHNFQVRDNVDGHRPPLKYGDASHVILCKASVLRIQSEVSETREFSN